MMDDVQRLLCAPEKSLFIPGQHVRVIIWNRNVPWTKCSLDRVCPDKSFLNGS